jgi:hypothetical protein
MNRKDIFRMAREADREWDCDRNMVEWVECFAALVAAAEREACAKVCESVAALVSDSKAAGAEECAAAIRARGEALNNQ